MRWGGGLAKTWRLSVPLMGLMLPTRERKSIPESVLIVMQLGSHQRAMLVAPIGTEVAKAIQNRKWLNLLKPRCL